MKYLATITTIIKRTEEAVIEAPNEQAAIWGAQDASGMGLVLDVDIQDIDVTLEPSPFGRDVTNIPVFAAED